MHFVIFLFQHFKSDFVSTFQKINISIFVMERSTFPHLLYGKINISTFVIWEVQHFHICYMGSSTFPHLLYGKINISIFVIWKDQHSHICYMERSTFPHFPVHQSMCKGNVYAYICIYACTYDHGCMRG